jgi:hypothetical protein
VADLYSESAVIKNLRRYPDGRVLEMTMSGSVYRTGIRATMFLAKLRGDVNRSSNVKYALEGDNVRVTWDRYSELKDYTSPMEWLVGQDSQGRWVILEEISESRP